MVHGQAEYDEEWWRTDAPLHAAAEGGHADALALLLAADADVDRGHPTNTPLHAAAKGGRLRCVRALLEAGADVSLTHPSGDWYDHEISLLVLAWGPDDDGEAVKGPDERLQIAKLLLLNGADANGFGSLVGETGGACTPRKLAVYFADHTRSPAWARLALRHGADTWWHGLDGWRESPLHTVLAVGVETSEGSAGGDLHQHA